jgi:hypothetical protein
MDKKDFREEDREFVDPVVATPVFIFVIKNIFAAIISFFTFQALQKWWKKKHPEEVDSAE